MAKAVSASQNGLTRVYTNDDGWVTVLNGGSRNWRNNNSGNLRYGTSAKARAAGAIGDVVAGCGPSHECRGGNEL